MEPGTKLGLVLLLCYLPWMWFAIKLWVHHYRSMRGWLPKRFYSKRISKWEDPNE
jgi:hypothetical protein